MHVPRSLLPLASIKRASLAHAHGSLALGHTHENLMNSQHTSSQKSTVIAVGRRHRQAAVRVVRPLHARPLDDESNLGLQNAHEKSREFDSWIMLVTW